MMLRLDQLVVVLAVVAWMRSTVAVAPCSDDIIKGFRLYSQCYADGNPPEQQGTGELGTLILYSKGDLSSDVVCVTSQQGEGHEYINYKYLDKFDGSEVYENVFHKDYIDVKKDEKTKYRVYKIHNENGIYSTYTCLADGDGDGGECTGTHSVQVVVNCKYFKEAVASTLPWGGIDSLAVVEGVKKCFNLLNISDVVPLQPCNCWPH